MVIRGDLLQPGRTRISGHSVLPEIGLDPRLDVLRRLERGWDGGRAPVPSERALNIAQAALVVLAELGAPVRVAADAEGGVALYVQSDRPGRFAWLNIDNEDEPGLLLSDRTTGARTHHPVGSPDALRALLPVIRSFVAGDR